MQAITQEREPQRSCSHSSHASDQVRLQLLPPGRYTAMVWEVLQMREGQGRAGDGVQGERYTFAGENAGLTEESEGGYNDAIADERLQKDIEMTKAGAFPSEIFNETGYHRMMNGDIRDPDTNEIKWRASDEGTGRSETASEIGVPRGLSETAASENDGRRGYRAF